MTNIFSTIKDNHGNEVTVVYLKDVKRHPLNEDLYPRDEHISEINTLAASMQLHYNEHGYPNHTAIEVCPATGTIMSGNFRSWGAEENKFKFLYAKVSPTRYDPTLSDYQQYLQLEKYNLDGKRDESNPVTAVRTYKRKALAYFKEYGKAFSNKMINAFAMERGIQPKSFRQMIRIYDFDKKLLMKVANDVISLAKANNLTKQGKPVLKADPDRFDFYNHMDKNPDIKKNIMTWALDATNQFLNIKMNGLNPITSDEFGIEINHLSGTVSNFFMSAAAMAFDKSGILARTPRLKTGHPDVEFPGISKEGYEHERLEVKCSSYAGSAAKTKFFGGQGCKRINPHDHLLTVWDNDCKKIFAVITTLNKDDWNDNDLCMSMKTWFENHYEKGDYTILAGDVYRSRTGQIEIQFDNVSDYA
tara:strand:- start:1494 stop:2744 length:1251 start_codon:yes stop_codon:yes gene_type:complete